jgi:hypothetical protein
VRFRCFGGLTAEKRVPQILKAFAATLTDAPSARLLAGDSPAAADLGAEHPATRPGRARRAQGLPGVRRGADRLHRGLRRVAQPQVADGRRGVRAVARCPALGLATVVVDLEHLADVPSLDPRTWQTQAAAPAPRPSASRSTSSGRRPLAQASAMRRLATQPALRDALAAPRPDCLARAHAHRRHD